MKYIAVILLITVAACKYNRPVPPKAAKSNELPAIDLPQLNYDSCKKQVSLVKQQYRANWAQLKITAKEKIVTAAIVETIIPSWIGTAWDFNGTTQVPRKGTIACGYFVTTVLRDGGFTIARAKLAQCASEQLIRALVQPKYIHRFSNSSMAAFVGTVQSEKYGLYLVGLDNHVGFIYNDGTEVYFIHATYAGPRAVLKERAVDSWVLKKSKYKVLGKLTADEKILNSWIN